jgi:molecular chaperone GrpE
MTKQFNSDESPDEFAEDNEEFTRKALEHPSYEELEAKLNEVEAQLNEANSRNEEYKTQVLRAQADIENAWKRAQKDSTNQYERNLSRFISELLPIIDGIERGLEIEVNDNEFAKRIHEGMEMTLKMFIDTLGKFAVKQINPLNEPFNPELHQAISTQVAENLPENTVIKVLQKGYQLNDRLIRPALVIVAKVP